MIREKIDRLSPIGRGACNALRNCTRELRLKRANQHEDLLSAAHELTDQAALTATSNGLKQKKTGDK